MTAAAPFAPGTRVRLSPAGRAAFPRLAARPRLATVLPPGKQPPSGVPGLVRVRVDGRRTAGYWAGHFWEAVECEP